MRHSVGLLIATLLMASPASAGQTEARDPVGNLDGQSIETPPGNPDAETIDQARENYREILDLASNDPALHVEVLRRLGDLELDAAEASQLDANAETLDLSGFDNAVELYQQLLESYPDYPHNDAVLYQLARAFELGGRNDDALGVLDELIDRYPETSIIHDVQFRRGEMLFLRKDYDTKKAMISDLMRFPSSSVEDQPKTTPSSGVREVARVAGSNRFRD